MTTRRFALLVPVVSIACSLPASADAEPVHRGGVVAADHEMASQAGLAMLEAGGNAVDAAVAASFCLSVVRPMSCGIGGGGFMLVHLQDDPNTPEVEPVTIAIDHRETAPAGVEADYFERMDDPLASRFGGAAIATPGTVRGLLLALERWGSLDRATVLRPAIEAAQRGFTVDAYYADMARDLTGWFEQAPERQGEYDFVWERFLKEGAVQEGDTIRLPEQALALRMIARDGAAAFYEGEIAEAIAEAAQDAGGRLSRRDLREYEPRLRDALRGEYRGATILTMPPPSSGGVATLQALGIIKRLEADRGSPLGSQGLVSAEYAHMLIEAWKHAFADRARWMGDPDFAEVPVQRLLSDGYLRELADRFDPAATQPAEAYGSSPTPPDDAGTSHLSVVDAFGNAVACTQTINLSFGSRVAVEDYGFCLNNEMDDFTTRRGEANAFGLRQSDANLPASGKRPLSSMSPTIALGADGLPVVVAGASGGPRIITATMQALLNVLIFDMTAREAVEAPRFHHQWKPDFVLLEPGLALPRSGEMEMTAKEMVDMMNRVERVSDFRRGLERRGHRLGDVAGIGVVQLIERAEGGYRAASDPRKGGAPAGR